MLRLSFIFGGTALLGSSGCNPPAGDGKTSSAAGTSAPAATLRVVVADDAELGQAIQREWHARTEGEIEVAPAALKDLSDASRLPGDVVIFPSLYLGTLVERGLIRPLSDSLLSSESLAMQDVFPLIRQKEITWAGKEYALPLGSPQFVLVYRPDVLERLGLAAPQTWEDYQTAVAKMSDRALLADAAPPADQPWRAAAEPVGPGYGGSLLLARAAAYASHPEQATQLFELATLEPLIDRPPYVRALAELAASVKAGEQGSIASPGDAWSELLAGRCAMALTWPHGNSESDPHDDLPLAFAELPGSPMVFSFRHNQWGERGPKEDRRVPFLGAAGRMAAVTTASSQGAAAEGLAAWMSGSEVSSRIASRSRGTTLFRASHRSALDLWAAGLKPAEAQQYFQVVEQSQSHPRSMSTVRLPGAERYMAALDSAVQRTVLEGQEPQSSLDQAASGWRKISAELGLPAQRSALAHSLGRQFD